MCGTNASHMPGGLYLLGTDDVMWLLLVSILVLTPCVVSKEPFGSGCY